MLLGQTWRREILEFYSAVVPRDEWNVTYIPSEIYGTMGNLLASRFPIAAINLHRRKIPMQRERGREDRPRQTKTDRPRQTQAETDRDRRRQTETDETDRDRQRQTETNRDRQR